MVSLIAALEPHQDAGGIIHAGLDDIDLLETTRQSTVLLKDLGIFLIGGGADTTQQTIGEQRLDEVGRIQLTTGGRPCPYDGVDLVDEQDRPFLALDLLEQHLEALLEITAILGPRQQRAHVQRINSAARNHLRHIALTIR